MLKKRISRIMTLVLGIMIVGAFAACGGDDDPDNGNGNDTGPTPTPGGNAPSTSGELTITALGDYNGKWVFAQQVFSSYARFSCSCGGNAADCSCDEGEGECGCEGCANYAPEPPEPTSFLLAGENFNINVSQQSMTYYGAQISGGQAKLKVWSLDVETITLGSYNGNDKKVEMMVAIITKPSVANEELSVDTWFGGGGWLEADFTAGKATAAFTAMDFDD